MEGAFLPILGAVHILDASVFFLLMILAALSKKIGEALAVPHFYHYYYGCAIALIFLIAADIVLPNFMNDADKNEISTTTMALRAMLVLSTFPVTMIYWRWLFSENLKK
ncbi:MAG: hypothetical protein FWE23_04695 [Chitinivibrionia bacterium]|jgi:Kef-type K+ transport system membrane component KefB|nr:hypothetical protein [Chitinivibrionia bacterium]